MRDMKKIIRLKKVYNLINNLNNTKIILTKKNDNHYKICMKKNMKTF